MAKIVGKFETLELETLKEHPANPRMHGAVAKMAEAIHANGFYGAVVVQKSTNYVLAGHARLWFLAENGHTQIPCMVADVDDDTALRILLTDNRTSDLGVRDCAGLLALMEPMDSVAGTGYTPGEMEKMRALLDPPEHDWFEDMEPVDPEAFWPRLTFKAPMEDIERFTKLMGTMGHESTTANLRAMLQAYAETK